MTSSNTQTTTDYKKELQALAVLLAGKADTIEDPKRRLVAVTLCHMQETGVEISLGTLASRMHQKQAELLKIAQALMTELVDTPAPRPLVQVDISQPEKFIPAAPDTYASVDVPLPPLVSNPRPRRCDDWTFKLREVPPEKLQLIHFTPTERRMLDVFLRTDYQGIPTKELAAKIGAKENTAGIVKTHLKAKLIGLLGPIEVLSPAPKIAKTPAPPKADRRPLPKLAPPPVVKSTEPTVTTPEKQQLLNRIAEHLEYYIDVKEHPLRPKQIQVMRDLIAALRAGSWGGTVIRPTGTGKTVIFSAIIQALQELREELLEEHHTVDGHGFLILVPTNYLAEQTYHTMVEEKRKNGRPLFGFPKDDVAILKSENNAAKKGEALAAPNLIMTYAYFDSLSKRAKEELQERSFTVMDEVDVAKGKKHSPLFSGWTKNNFTLGFSATEKFIESDEVRSINDVLFDGASPLHKTSLVQAARDGEISPIRNVLFVTDLDSGIERKVRNKKREYTQEEIASIVDQPGRDDAAIKAIAEFVDPNNGIAFKDLNQIWFCMGVSHAGRIATRLNSIYQQTLPDGSLRYPYGYAVSVSSETPRQDWVDLATGKTQPGLYTLLEKHRQGEIPVLCNADLLIRGYDSPLTQLCVMLRPTRSPTLTEQAGGRIGRLDPNNPDKLGYVASFFDKDTASAMCFTDVAKSVFIGPEGQENRTHFKASTNETRTPDLSAMNTEKKVEVITIFEPRKIEKFLKEKRQPKVKGMEEMPSDFVSGPMAAAAQGLPEKYYKFEPYHALVTAYNEAVASQSDSLTFKHPQTGEAITVPMSDVGYYLPPKGGGHHQLCLRRGSAEKVFKPVSIYPRLSPGFVNLHEATHVKLSVDKRMKDRLADFYSAVDTAHYNQVDQCTPPPATFDVEWSEVKIRIPAHAVQRFDTSKYYGMVRDEIAIHPDLMSSIYTLVDQQETTAPKVTTDRLRALMEKAYAANLESFSLPLLDEKPPESFGVEHQVVAIQNNILANLPLRSRGLQAHFVGARSQLCKTLLERVVHAWVYHAATAPNDKAFIVPMSGIFRKDEITLHTKEFGYYRDPNLVPAERFFITRQGVADLTRAICGELSVVDWTKVLDQEATTQPDAQASAPPPTAPSATWFSPIAPSDDVPTNEPVEETPEATLEQPPAALANGAQFPIILSSPTSASEGVSADDRVLPFAQRVTRHNGSHPQNPETNPPPQKTDEWFGTADMANVTSRNITLLSRLYKALQPAWEKAMHRGEDAFSAEGLTFETSQAGMFSRGDKDTIFCLHRECQDMVRNHRLQPVKLGHVLQQTPDGKLLAGLNR